MEMRTVPVNDLLLILCSMIDSQVMGTYLQYKCVGPRRWLLKGVNEIFEHHIFYLLNT